MSSLNRFLQRAESRALAEHEARLAGVRRLEALPDLPLSRADREAALPPFRQGHKPSAETCLAVYRACRGGLTPLHVAERFECSERTIFRMLERERSATSRREVGA